MVATIVNCRLLNDGGTRERMSRRCAHRGVVRGARLLLTILIRHPSPAMVIDLTGSEITTLNTLVERAIADDCHLALPLIPIIFAELDRSAHVSRDGHRRRL